MTTVVSTGAATAAQTASKQGFSALGSADFLKLMTVQMQQQDPFDPMDNKEMLAQMAQFSSLSEIGDVSGGIGQLNATMKEISTKLDAVLTAQEAAKATSVAAA